MNPHYTHLDVNIAGNWSRRFFAVSHVANGIVVGCVTSRVHTKTSSFWDLFVHPDWRRYGIGKELVKMCEGRALEMKCVSVSLVINKGNEEVEAFYSKLGYAPCSEWDTGDVLWVKVL